ncbi:DNA-binding transcription factor [Lithospermum erythrorhizon]|uniref:DNA-binding transcription factor n=1 Tax=Lithospermum erythrorhizon TaxID=34254 RepID=A0AAV3PL52_LITER
MDLDPVVEDELKKEYILSPTTPAKLVPPRPYCLPNVMPISVETSVLEQNHVHLINESPQVRTPPQESILKRRQVKKSIAKRYRPKIDDETKIPKINISKPKRSSSKIVDGTWPDKKIKYVKSANSSIPASEHIFVEKSCRRSLDFGIDPQNFYLCQHENVNLQQQNEDFSQGEHEKKDEERVSFSFKWDFSFNLPPQDFENCVELKKLIKQYKRNISSVNGGDQGIRKLGHDISDQWKKRRLKRRRRVSFDKLNDLIAEICCLEVKGNKVGIDRRRKNLTHSSSMDFSSTPLLDWSLFKRKRSTRPFVRRNRSLPLVSPPTEANTECSVEVEENTAKCNNVESCHQRPNNVLQNSCSENGTSTISKNLAMPDFVTFENDVDTHTQNGLEGASAKLLIDAANNQQLGPPLIGDEPLQQMILYHDKNGALVPYKEKKYQLEVDIDQDTTEMWKLLTENGERSADEIKESEEWRKRRDLFRERAEEFISLMHHFQGNRKFTPWKGSVIDSVVGTFLTQNVSDTLSSSAFMSLRARYPAKPKGNDKDDNEEKTCNNAPVEETNDVNNELSDVCEASPPVESLSTACEIGAHDHREKSNFFRETLQLEQSNFLEQFYDHPSVEVISDHVDRLPSNSTSEEMANRKSNPPRKSGTKGKKVNLQPVDWDELRKTYSSTSRDRTDNRLDSVDWEAVRQAPVKDIEATIQKRGQQEILSRRIKALLERLVKDHGSTDLEWLRDVPPVKAKEFLLSIDGLGQKSVECIRLLTLHHKAFPVDTNVARIVVRLGWIPLKPLPENIQLHALSEYPQMDDIQKYLWPRLCTLDQPTLYELHYQLITFGKVFCIKRSPNCNGCPMRAECKHKASKDGSLLLPGPEHGSTTNNSPPSPELVSLELLHHSENDDIDYCQPLFSLSHEEALKKFKYLNEPEELTDIEDLPFDAKKDEDHSLNFINYGMEFLKHLENSSQELVKIPLEKDPKDRVKNKAKLRTEHQVFELPDDHPLLVNLNKREADDPSPYLFAIPTIGRSSISSLEKIQQLDLNQSETSTKDNPEVQEPDMVYGTILHPCRTALKGNFPLNGTYFQVNEVFVDFASSQMLIGVPESLLCNLPLRTLFCGNYISSIVKGLSNEEIISCFCERGFICVRGFVNDTGAPRQLPDSFHCITPNKGKKPQEWWG